MHYTLERLVDGDKSVGESFEKAAALFKELFVTLKDADEKAWAQWLTSNQSRFEMQCGGRWEGQEVMAWAGFAMLYNTLDGFVDQDTARKLHAAWQQSSTSMECKGAAEQAAASYHVMEDE